MRFLLEEAGATTSVTQWILPAVLLVLVIGIFVLNYFRSKKNQEGLKTMVSSLKVGDNVKTYSGLYGKIIEITETTDGKVAVLETGSGINKGVFSIDINAIYGIDAKQPVVLDINGNVIDPNAPVEPVVEEIKSEIKEEKSVEKTKKPASKEKKVESKPVEEVKVDKVKPEEVKAKKTSAKTSIKK